MSERKKAKPTALSVRRIRKGSRTDINKDTWFYEARGSIKVIAWFHNDDHRRCHTFRAKWKPLAQWLARQRPELFNAVALKELRENT